MNYKTFLAAKRIETRFAGIEPKEPHEILFPFQRDIVKWALRRGRACVWADCGLGKTFIQLEWARQIPGNVLILAPLAVANQTIAEAVKIGCVVRYCRNQSEVKKGITIANYEMLEHFDPAKFKGIVLDESSIIKHFEGKFRNAIITGFAETPFRLACTATPAPNDHMELGNHAEFVGAMSRTEMLSMFFVHDGGDTSKWRLKGHAEKEFWKWVCSWAVMIRKPSDLGYEDNGFILPPMTIEQISVEHQSVGPFLFAMEAQTLQERIAARRESVSDRVAKCAELVKSQNSAYILSNEPTGLHETLGREESRQGESLSSENARAPKPAPPSTLCEQRSEAHQCAAAVESVLDKTPRQTQGTKVETLRDNPQGLSSDDEKAGREVRDLSIQGDERSKHVPVSRSLPRHKASEGIAVHELQSGTREVQTSNRTIEVCDSISRKEPWLIWCQLNKEQEELETQFGSECISITGSMPYEEKARLLASWLNGDRPIMVSKPSIIGFGINAQHCRNVAFVGLSDSWEQYYQAVRRCWRFGQTKDVRVHIITSTAEGAVVANIKRKEADAAKMALEMVKHMHSMNEQNIKGTGKTEDAYVEDVARGENYELHLGDCVEVAKKIPSNSIGFSIFSPPFASLYTYSASDRDMGNCKSHGEFSRHFAFLSGELFRVTQPGRLLSFHCMNLPFSKTRDGYIGLRDFRGELIRCFIDAGFIFHSEVCIWKDPVTAMQRTKALGLLHKQMAKDSCMSRQGVPDYLVTMRKPGENQNPVEGELDRWIGDESFRTQGRLSIDLWQRYASPVWMDIDAGRTLQRESAREEKDERHICPLQLDVIERAMELWSNPGDTVLSPFAGIGSEGFVALSNDRKFIGIELKASYWKQAASNLALAEAESARDLFAKTA